MIGAPLIITRHLRAAVLVMPKSNQCSHLHLPLLLSFGVPPFTPPPIAAAEIQPMIAQPTLVVVTSVQVPFHEISSCLGGSKKIKISPHHQDQGGRCTMHVHRLEKDQNQSMSLRYYRGDLIREMVISQRRMVTAERIKIKTRRIDPSHHQRSQVWQTLLP